MSRVWLRWQMAQAWRHTHRHTLKFVLLVRALIDPYFLFSSSCINIHCSKKLKEQFFIRIWHEFSCTFLIMIWSVKWQRGLLISFSCIGVDGIINRCTRGATLRRPPKPDWFCMWRPFQVSPSWSFWTGFPLVLALARYWEAFWVAEIEFWQNGLTCHIIFSLWFLGCLYIEPSVGRKLLFPSKDVPSFCS